MLALLRGGVPVGIERTEALKALEWLHSADQRLFGICCLADRRRSGADGEGVGFAGEDHDHRKPRSLSRVETLGEADREAQSFGLLTPTGINSTTGIAGLTLGGGFGWISHKFGLTADN